MKVEKKIWPRHFEQIKNKKHYVEIRLADFELNVGDTLVVKEWDPVKQEYTGKKLEFKAKDVKKLDLRKYYSMEDLSKHGVYAIELER